MSLVQGMSQADTGAKGGSAPAGPPRAIHRPLSPHLQIWRWHTTMAGSILNRASGVACHVGAFVVTAWIVALAAGPETYEAFLQVAASPFGLLIWFGLSFALFLHLAGGLRHFAWDVGALFRPKTADFVTWLSFVFAVVATIALWAFLIFSGRVTL